jgi:hypothetical protein
MINFMGFCANQSIFRCAPTDDHTRGESSAGSGSAKAAEKEGKTERKITCKVKRTRVVFFLGPTGLRICVRVNFSGALK